MAYFSKFPKGVYDIAGNKQFKLVTDIMRRVKVRAKIINEASLYDDYDVPSGERPEVTAFKHFGDTELHWVILLTNDITDAYYGWPLSDQDFEKYVTDKYANPQGIHHYEITQSSGNTTVSNYEYERREQDKLRSIKLLDPAFLGLFIEEFERLVSQ